MKNNKFVNRFEVVELGCTDWSENKDKTYKTELKESVNGWRVRCTYGRRHGNQQVVMYPGNWTSYNGAVIIRDKIVQSKLKKGYTIEEQY